ncbi:hypothetical protein HPB51_014602 [Rhipicephalus microplus]|uniref:AAA+ ATPase domain-containing protein n=1 Tax=Rhipicephalus microplus TaxID=6941 RepID=A0A9J6F418_RHIMP|nr:hypothetical protein HPB51_014602 [Rhipicephalus microplus]
MTLTYAGSEDRLAGSQVCEVPVAHLISMNCMPRSLVKVSVLGKAYLCVVYPHRFTSDVVYVDGTVELQINDGGTTDNTVLVEPLDKSQPADSAVVTVVLRSVHDLVKWHGVRQERLSYWLSRILRKYYVKSGSTFVCPSSRPLSRLCAVHAIVVDQVSPSSADACRVTANTKLTVAGVTYSSAAVDRTVFSDIWEQTLREPTALLGKLCMFPHTYPKTLEAVGLRLHRGILLTGPPGTGKTSVVRHVAQKCGAHLLTVKGPELCRSAPGESEALLRSIFSEAATLSEVLPCIVLMEDADLLCVKRGSASSQHANRLVTQLLTLMDGMEDRRRVFVVATTTRPNSIDPAMRRPGRFDKEVTCFPVQSAVMIRKLVRPYVVFMLFIGALSTQERTDIMRTVGSQLGIDLSHLVLPTAGFVLGDIMTLLRESLMAAIKRTPSSDKEALVTVEDFKTALTTVQSNLNSRLEFAVEVVPRFSWKQLGGIECLRKKLQAAMEGPLLNPSAFGRLGVSQPRGVLLVGPHGCGKTVIALAAASSCPGVTLFSLGAADVYSPFVGDSEKVVSEVFRQARLRAPSAIFMDDLDTLVGRRSGEHSGSQERILSALLCEIDGIDGLKGFECFEFDFECFDQLYDVLLTGSGVLQRSGHTQDQQNVILVATTANPDAVDEALLRPGRFDLIVYVPPPDAQTREQILKVSTAKMALGDVDLMSLANRTEYFTAADLVHLCHVAGLQAMSELGFNAPCVEQRHFEEALRRTFPSLCPQKVEHLRQQCAKFCLVT